MQEGRLIQYSFTRKCSSLPVKCYSWRIGYLVTNVCLADPWLVKEKMSLIAVHSLVFSWEPPIKYSSWMLCHGYSLSWKDFLGRSLLYKEMERQTLDRVPNQSFSDPRLETVTSLDCGSLTKRNKNAILRPVQVKEIIVWILTSCLYVTVTRQRNILRN